MGIDKFYQKGVFPALTVGGVEYFGGVYPTAGRTYYVSKQGNNSNGLNWKNAFTTLAAAIAASNAYVLTYVNVINRIYVDGGNYTESLVAFPNHCEIIGVGTMSDGPRVNASTIIANAPSICHIYNMQFRTATAAPILDLGSTPQGIWLINCLLNNVSGIAPTHALKFGDVAYYNKVINCRFIGNPSPTIGIYFGGQNTSFTDIIGNEITAITAGVDFASDNGASYSDYQVYIKDNVICRSDPNSSDQLAYGVRLNDTQSRTDCMIVHNWISAADAIYGANANNTIDNHINQAGVGTIESPSA
jgi:hypothetical protein